MESGHDRVFTNKIWLEREARNPDQPTIKENNRATQRFVSKKNLRETEEAINNQRKHVMS